MGFLKRSMIGAIVGVVGLAVASPAHANDHAVVYWYNSTQNAGASTDLWVAPGAAADWSSGGHINQTLWEGTNNTTNVTYWAEAGYTYAYHAINGLWFYWADNIPNAQYPYHDHRVATFQPTQSSWANIAIQYTCCNSWDITIKGQLVQSYQGDYSESNNNPPFSNSIQSGLETTSSSSYLLDAYSANLHYFDMSNNAHDWTGGIAYHDPPSTSSWVSQDTEMTDDLN